jgi:hypothetical protein
MGIDPQPILMDEVYDEAALSSAMRARARVRWGERQWVGDEAHGW